MALLPNHARKGPKKGGPSPNPAGRGKNSIDKRKAYREAGIKAATTPMAYAQSLLDDPNTPTPHKQWAAAQLFPYVHRKQPMAVETRDLTREEESKAADAVKKIEQILAEKARARNVGAEKVGVAAAVAEDQPPSDKP